MQEKARIEAQYAEALIKLADTAGLIVPSGSVSKCWSEIRDVTRVTGEKHSAKSSIIQHM
jgi:hypothetical protein